MGLTVNGRARKVALSRERVLSGELPLQVGKLQQGQGTTVSWPLTLAAGSGPQLQSSLFSEGVCKDRAGENTRRPGCPPAHLLHGAVQCTCACADSVPAPWGSLGSGGDARNRRAQALARLEQRDPGAGPGGSPGDGPGDGVASLGQCHLTSLRSAPVPWSGRFWLLTLMRT